VTPDPGFKVTVVLKGKYLENGALYTQSYYGTVIGNICTLSTGKPAIQLTTPLLLRKACKLFASVARVSASAGLSCCVRFYQIFETGLSAQTLKQHVHHASAVSGYTLAEQKVSKQQLIKVSLPWLYM